MSPPRSRSTSTSRAQRGPRAQRGLQLQDQTPTHDQQQHLQNLQAARVLLAAEGEVDGDQDRATASQQNRNPPIAPTSSDTKRTKWSQDLKLGALVASSVPTITDQTSLQTIARIIADVRRKGHQLLQMKEFIDAFEAKFTESHATQVQTIRAYPDVAEAYRIADTQQTLYSIDIHSDSPEGVSPVPPGNYDAAPSTENGVVTINSYFELFAKYMLQDLVENWVSAHAQLHGISKDRMMKDNMKVVDHANKNFRAHADSVNASGLPTLPDWHIANQFFASLTTELKTAILDNYAGYFQEGARPLQQ